MRLLGVALGFVVFLAACGVKSPPLPPSDPAPELEKPEPSPSPTASPDANGVKKK